MLRLTNNCGFPVILSTTATAHFLQYSTWSPTHEPGISCPRHVDTIYPRVCAVQIQEAEKDRELQSSRCHLEIRGRRGTARSLDADFAGSLSQRGTALPFTCTIVDPVVASVSTVIQRRSSGSQL
jgi:hypothetical protein